MGIIYLASPYSHKSEVTKELRYREISRLAATLVCRGEVIFCPISMSHSFSKWGYTPTTWEFWEHQDIPFLKIASELWVATLDGWEESVGVQAEIRYAQDHKIPISLVDPKTGLRTSYDQPYKGVF